MGSCGELNVPGFPGGKAQARLLLGGDFCPVGRYGETIAAGEPVFDDILAAAFRDADFSLINLEAPLCSVDLPCAHPGEKGLRADRGVAGFLQRLGVRAVGLANNHIRDFGLAGFRQTAQALDRCRILRTGAGRNLAEAQEPLAVTVNGLRLGVWALAERELNAATDREAGSSWFRPEEDAERIREMRGRFDFLLVYVHAGHEFMSVPSPRIRAAYRRLAEAGADAVVAHHPHVVQGAEVHRGKLIAYSLGNLVFDSPYVSRHPDTDRGFLLRLGIAKRRITEASLIPYALRDSVRVTALDRAEAAAFARRFRALSKAISNERQFSQNWEQNVARRWAEDYRPALAALKTLAPHRAKNLLTCPTHAELLAQAFDLMSGGKLARGFE